MITKDSVLRVARPTDNLEEVTKMYLDGLGFELIGSFDNHNEFDGRIIGHKEHNYHLEFTHHRGTKIGKAPSMDNLIVFYIGIKADWEKACEKMLLAGFKDVKSYNPYWNLNGRTFEDIDGYRVVLQNSNWEK